MSMGMSLSLRPSLTQELSQQLSQEQRLTLRLSLVQKLALRLHGKEDAYRPKGTCPNCLRRLTPAEIMLGFNHDPNDLTTKCPKCKHRFAPILVATGKASTIEMPFYCRIQTLEMLKHDMVGMLLAEFKSAYASIYRSALYHFGSLKAAFEQIGLRYTQEPRISAWQKKVLSFLGKLPDAVIANNANVSVREVRKLRKEKGIDPYRRGS